MTEPPLRIAMFIYCLSGGGAQRRTVMLANGFAERGQRVDLVVVSAAESRISGLHPDVRVVPLDRGWRRRLGLRKRGLGPRAILTAGTTPVLARYLRRERPDVFVSAANHVHLTAIWAWRFAGRPIPLVLRASNQPGGQLEHWWGVRRFIRRLLTWMARHVYPWANGIIAVSEGVATELRKIPGIHPDRVTVIYNPVIPADLDAKARQPVAHPWLVPGGPPVVLGVGKLKIQKDFPTLLRAFRRVRAARETHLIIIGEGRQRPHLEHLVRHLGIADDVALPGHADNPFAWMSKASVFVLSSLWEGLPGVLIEAMACGCPVVSTDCTSGPREILLDGALGPLVPVGDDQAMARAILSSLDAPADPEQLRLRAARFRIDPAVDRYLMTLRDEARRWATQPTRT